jgi:hypothetical protein
MKKYLALFALLILVKSLCAQFPTQGLVAYYPLNGNANDYSGFGNNGTIYGASPASDRAGIANGAYNFDGISNYISVSNSARIDTCKYISLCAWIKPSLFGSNLGIGINPIIFKGYYNAASPYGQYQLGVSEETRSSVPQTFNFCLSINQQYIHIITPNFTWQPGIWYFVVGTYDGDSLKLFVNGNELASLYSPGIIDTYSQDLQIMKNDKYSVSWGTSYTPGTADEIRIYNRALDQNEITALYKYSGSFVYVSNNIISYNDTAEIAISTDSLKVTDHIISYQFNARYDSTKLNYVGFDLKSTLADSGIAIVNANVPGLLNVSFMSSYDLVGLGDLIKLKFRAIGYDSTSVSLDHFLFNTSNIANTKSGLQIIPDLRPKGNITYNEASEAVRFSDSLMIKVVFNRPLLSSPPPQIQFNGAINTSAADLTCVNDTVFVFNYLVPKSAGKVTITLDGGLDSTGNEVYKFPSSGSEFTVLPLNFGDVDDNSHIQAFDAALTLQYSVGLSPVKVPTPWAPWRIATANVDDTGAITANDAAWILKYSANIVTSFPANNLKAFNQNSADVNISFENDAIVFRPIGGLYGLNVSVNNNKEAIGLPEFYDTSMLIATNIDSAHYAIGLASAYGLQQDNIFMKIPLKSTEVSSISMDMIINSTPVSRVINTVTSVKSLELNSLMVYPNPANDYLKFNIPAGHKNMRILIYSIEGKLVINQILISDENSICISSLLAGLYTIKIEGLKTIYTQMFIKK